MNCEVCWNTDKSPIEGAQDCFEMALDTIRTHYIFFRTKSSEQSVEVKMLQERNAKLVRAVQMLQNQAAKLTANISAQTIANQQSGILKKSLDCVEIPPTETMHSRQVNPSLKRAVFQTLNADGQKCRTNTDKFSECTKRQKLNMPSDLSQIFSTDYDDVSFIDDAGCIADLNTALHSEQLLDTTSASVASSQLPNDNSFAENEKLRSPRIKDQKTIENRIALANVTNDDDGKGSSKSGWMSKANTSLRSAQTVANNVSSAVFKKKPSLSLSRRGSGAKLKQTRLQLDVSREKSFNVSDTTFCEEAVEVSPNRAMLKSKETRSWLLRTGNITANDSSTKLNNQSDIKTTFDSASATPEDIFKFNQVTNEAIKSDCVQMDLSDEFELRPEDDLEPLYAGFQNIVAADSIAIDRKPSGAFEASSNDSGSVVMLTPAVEDVIFLESEPPLFTLDLLDGLAGPDHYMRLKRLETEKINKLKQDAVKPDARAAGKTAKSSEHEAKPELNPCVAKIKLEPVSKEQGNVARHLEMVQCAIVKQEQEQIKTRLGLGRINQEKRISIKERYNIDCDECEKYINFLGDGVKDEAVFNILSKCKHQQEMDALKNATPEGFWNPLLESFDTNDPRNEVLIDTRFVGKQRTGRYGNPKI